LVLSVEPELFETKVVRLAAQPLGVVLFFASSPSWTQAMSHGAVLALITLSMVCIHVKTRSDEFHTQDREPKPQPWWTATAPWALFGFAVAASALGHVDQVLFCTMLMLFDMVFAPFRIHVTLIEEGL
jgi:hypothetical protein